MSPSPMHVAIFCAALAPCAGTLAQQDLAAAEQRYQRTLAYCNNGTLPRPERDACVRDAGYALERARGGISTGEEDVTSPSGRATVVIPDGSPPPLSDSTTVTSPDGRSTIVLPAGGSRPLPNQ